MKFFLVFGFFFLFDRELELIFGDLGFSIYRLDRLETVEMIDTKMCGRCMALAKNAK